MTRLRSEDVEHIRCELKAYDQLLIGRTGKDLKGIASFAAGVSDGEIAGIVKANKICVVPMTCGQGVIGGFCDTVSGIVSHLGFDSFVAENSDAVGIAEAFEKQSDIILLADDNHFVAINVRTKYVSDNSEMTAKGFVAALDLMADGLKGENVLVLGCGEVGSFAAKILVDMDAMVSVSDIDSEMARTLKKEIAVKIDDGWTNGRYQYIIDATPSVNVIDALVITPDTHLAVPGVPCGLSCEAEAKLENRYLHDPLQIGVATMVIDTCKQ